MRRIVLPVFIGLSILASSVTIPGPGTVGYAASVQSDLPITSEDTAVFQLVPHTLTAALNKSTVTIDGVSTKVNSLLRQNGRLYFPAKWLETAKLAKIMKKTKTNSYWAEFNPGNATYFSFFHFKPNSTQLYTESNGKLTPLEDTTIPAPFMKNNTLYLPVSLLPRMGINYSSEKGILKWTWTDKSVTVLHPTYTTDKERITFRALVQKGYDRVYLMQNMGVGGMTSVIGGGIGSLKGSERTIDRAIKVGNREFNRIEYTVDLRPGPNPLQLYSNYMGAGDVMVYRKVANPASIPIRYNHDEYAKSITFEEPTQGYLQVPAGEVIPIAGTVTTEEDTQSNVVSFRVSKFQDGDFKVIGNQTVLKLDSNKAFSGSVKIDEPGSYLINIYSPDVFVGGMTLPYGSVKWAEIAVEVLPKSKS
ncbi:hypothetical protein [Paenibacillus guangzhouensis]|uniref:hypothetical protein n=1 Tax=Paenibacillus guangzhouensis TaxID=1473112 RepID=UPI001266A9E2|nr:hypothetical protein [Paenibacillus guangzhouensis]